MKKLVILVLVLVVAAVFWSKKSEKSQEENLEVNLDMEEVEPLFADPDELACEEAKNHKDFDSWKSYIEKFPGGKCAEKARVFFVRADKEACEKARKANTRAAWEKYLKKFPNGKCAEEGKAVRSRFQRVGNLEWSDALVSDTLAGAVSWSVANNYCKHLEEGGHTDWRVPNIDELRTLVHNHPGTVVGGKCGISEENNKLDEKDSADDCNGIDGNNFSKLGDEGRLWSSSHSVYREYDDFEVPVTWVIYFDDGAIRILLNYDDIADVRCVRQDEQDACETAKKYDKPDYWSFYFANFPDSECDTEAKATWEKEDEKACQTARKGNTRAAWERYLKKFPKGKCSDEGNTIRNKFMKIGRLVWSDISDNAMQGEEAYGYENDRGSYCHTLREGGHNDWRLPDIDELRVLVQNHPGTVSGGKCSTTGYYSEAEYFSDEEYDYNICRGIKGKNFSKLGDTEELWSSSIYNECRSTDSWSIDFSNGGILSTTWGYDRLYARCVRQEDNDVCEKARKEDTYESWINYLSLFPEGECAKEANAAVSDDAVCESARKTNTRAAWEDYLKKFPNGKCAAEGKTVRNRYKRVGNLEWSDIVDSWSYCVAIEEDGHNDWREPNIDELRTLVQNHPGTVAGGTCKIYEKDSLEFGREFDEIDCEETIDVEKNSENCDGIEGGNFSKLGDTGWLDSSSVSGWEYTCGAGKEETVFSISFDDGELSPNGSFGRKRCVRQDDPDACETAKKYNTIYYWDFYLEHFPNGKCSAEARTALDELNCEKMKKKDDIRYWDWKEYLKTFPQGKCAEEARTVLKKLDEADCKYARNVEDDSRFFERSWYWERYLEDFPEGKCAEEAKSVLKEYDIAACKKAKEKNEYQEWKNYFEKFPQGECATEAKKNIETMQTIGRLEWSKIASEMNWYDAVKYCRNLNELGYTDWRLPNIDELRTLIQNCSKTEPDGECKVSLKNKCLSDSCMQPENSCFCEETRDIEYSKLQDYGYRFWSSSTVSDNRGAAWRIDFSNAEVEDSYKVGENYVRCVKGSRFLEEYSKNFPQGKCAAEAENKVEKKEAKKVEPKKAADKKESKQPETNSADKKAMAGKKWSSKSPKVMSWKQANKYCENLKEGGSSNWRLPSISELRTLITKCDSTEAGGACGVTDQCLSADQCKNKSCKGCGTKVQHNKFGDKGFFWSSSISPENKNAWYIDFTYGSIHSHSNSEKFVRCVSHETTSGTDSEGKDESGYSSTKTFSSKESQTGNIWSGVSKKAMSLKQANQYCENLKEGGSSDWRLPTISELRTLITKCESTETGGTCRVTDQCLSADQCKNKSCRGCGRKIRHNKFGDRGFFWSSSISPDNKNAWYIDFTYGSIHNHSNSDKFVRCVR